MKSRMTILEEILTRPKGPGKVEIRNRRFLDMVRDFAEEHDRLNSNYKQMKIAMVTKFVDGVGVADRASFSKREKSDFTGAFILVETMMDIWARENPTSASF